MKKLVALLVVGLVSSNMFGASPELVEKLLKTMMMEEAFPRVDSFMIEGVNVAGKDASGIASSNSKAASIERVVEAQQKLKESLSWEALKPEIVKAYSEAFTDEEIKGLIKFYESPLGRKYLEKESEIQQKIMKSIMEKQQKCMSQFKKIREEAGALKRQTDQKHKELEKLQKKSE